MAGEWEAVTAALNPAYAFTVFGYSAPVSDVEAKALLHQAWDTNSSREMVETEIVDIKPKAALEETWAPFFYSHHYTLATGIGECSIGLYPRRSCEALNYQNLEARWVENTPMPHDVGFDELHDWLEPRKSGAAVAIVTAGYRRAPVLQNDLIGNVGPIR